MFSWMFSFPMGTDAELHTSSGSRVGISVLLKLPLPSCPCQGIQGSHPTFPAALRGGSLMSKLIIGVIMFWRAWLSIVSEQQHNQSLLKNAVVPKQQGGDPSHQVIV